MTYAISEGRNLREFPRSEFYEVILPKKTHFSSDYGFNQFQF